MLIPGQAQARANRLQRHINSGKFGENKTAKMQNRLDRTQNKFGVIPRRPAAPTEAPDEGMDAPATGGEDMRAGAANAARGQGLSVRQANRNQFLQNRGRERNFDRRGQQIQRPPPQQPGGMAPQQGGQQAQQGIGALLGQIAQQYPQWGENGGLPPGHTRSPDGVNIIGPNGETTLIGVPGYNYGTGTWDEGYGVGQFGGGSMGQPPRSSTLSPGIGLDGRPIRY